MINNRSSPLNSPISSPLPSAFRRWTVSSNQILRGFNVEIPRSLSSIFLMACFVTTLPLEFRPLIRISAKSRSHLSFLTLATCLRNIVITSASPFGLDEKYNAVEPLLPLVKSYSLSRVTPITEKRFT